jgi:hypothetical protein
MNNNPSMDTARASTDRPDLHQPDPVAASYKSTSRTSVQPQIYTSFAKDLKWIALVTCIVVILLIASYYLFR